MSTLSIDRQTTNNLVVKADEISELVTKNAGDRDLAFKLTQLSIALNQVGLSSLSIKISKAAQHADDRPAVHDALKAVFQELDS